MDFDLCVIGGGSGGMSAAREAGALGKKVLLLDYVSPSTQGTTWGFGGTCVNVGCVPKKLFHYFGDMAEAFTHDGNHGGWIFGEAVHDWNRLVENVTNHIRSLNFIYRSGLRGGNVTLVVGHGSIEKVTDEGVVVKVLKSNKEETTYSVKDVIVAVGGRPVIPDIPGAAEHALTSDDIFKITKSPGDTLVVGASYIALECAGFLAHFNYRVDVSMRSIPLRGFDRQCSEMIVRKMEETGVTFKIKAVPTEIVIKDGRKLVSFSDGSMSMYDTILYATGRYPATMGLGLENTEVKMTSGGYISTNDEDQAAPHVYAIGDARNNTPQLTPVAINIGAKLVRRLYSNSKDKINYDIIPTTVFTSPEYGTIGLSEENAHARYGEDKIETYLSEFQSLELSAVHRPRHGAADELDTVSPDCLAKLVTLKETGRVVGLHFVGPHAGEVVSGFEMAFIMGAHKSDFDKMIGIHPTVAEAFANLEITRSSGADFVAKGGCGGGKCG